MDSFEKLVNLFEEFPGIGPRQARRFAYFLLAKNNDYTSGLSTLVSNIKKEVSKCEICMRYFAKKGSQTLCSICADENRDRDVLMLVSKDNDLLAIEKSGAFSGVYFVLGGLIPILEKNPEKRIRKNELVAIVEKKIKEGLKEIIFALSATHEGEHTTLFIKKLLEKEEKNGLKFSELGRGLSTGSELEYADKDTIKSALKNKQ